MGLLQDFLKQIKDLVGDEAGRAAGVPGAGSGRLGRVIGRDEEALRRQAERERFGRVVGKEEGRLDQDQLDRFLNSGEWVPVSSSNVRAIRYLRLENSIQVRFIGKGGRPDSFYRYLQCDRGEAEDFYEAGSKGGWVWDALRIRGTKFGHKKPYMRIG